MFRREYGASAQLTRVLGLRSCRWQYGVAGLGQPARLLRGGDLVADQHRVDVAAEGLPPGRDIELLVESGGVFHGRFLMTPAPDARPTQEQRLVAVALADQVGSALAGTHPADRS